MESPRLERDVENERLGRFFMDFLDEKFASFIDTVSEQIHRETATVFNDRMTAFEADFKRWFPEYDFNGRTLKHAPDYVKIALADDDATKFRHPTVSFVDLCKKLQDLPGAHWNEVLSVKLVESTSRQSAEGPCLVIKVKTVYASKTIQDCHVAIYETLNISHKSNMVKPRYTVQVKDFETHSAVTKLGGAREAVQQINLPPFFCKKRITNNRLLLDTHDVKNAIEMCREPITLLGVRFHCIPFPSQGNPLFCRRCWLTGHFERHCTAPHPRCGKCADRHMTTKCDADIMRCPNCTQDHGAWDPRCTFGLSQHEHKRARRQRMHGPEWASMVQVSDPEAAVAQPSQEEPAKKGRGRPAKTEEEKAKDKKRKEDEKQARKDKKEEDNKIRVADVRDKGKGRAANTRSATTSTAANTATFANTATNATTGPTISRAPSAFEPRPSNRPLFSNPNDEQQKRSRAGANDDDSGRNETQRYPFRKTRPGQ